MLLVFALFLRPQAAPVVIVIYTVKLLAENDLVRQLDHNK